MRLPHTSTWSLMALLAWIQPRRVVSGCNIYDCLDDTQHCPSRGSVCRRITQAVTLGGGKKRSSPINYIEEYQTRNSAEQFDVNNLYDTYLRQPRLVDEAEDNDYYRFIRQLVQQYPIGNRLYDTWHKELPSEHYVNTKQDKYHPPMKHVGLLDLIADRKTNIQQHRSLHSPVHTRLRMSGTKKLNRADRNVLDWPLFIELNYPVMDDE